MSVARGFPNAGHFYSNIVKPIKLDLQFTVSAADSAGLGQTSLKSNGYVRNVFMHTSTTPGTNDGATNPNPASGYALIQLKQNFNAYLGLQWSAQDPNTGSIKIDNGATLTIGNPYTITTLGNATAAQWTTVGVPAGITPAVGVSFIALATGAGSGNTKTSRVSTPVTSAITSVEVIGNPNSSISNTAIASNGGAYLLVRFMAPSTNAVTSALTMDSYTPAGTNNGASPPIFSGTPAVLTGSIVNSGGATTLAATAPADASIVNLSIFFDGSSVTVDGL